CQGRCLERYVFSVKNTLQLRQLQELQSRGTPKACYRSLANFQAVSAFLTGEVARPTLWRGRPRPRFGEAHTPPPEHAEGVLPEFGQFPGRFRHFCRARSPVPHCGAGVPARVLGRRIRLPPSTPKACYWSLDIFSMTAERSNRIAQGRAKRHKR